MRTVHEISKLTGVSIRTLHYYDEIGLLSPTQLTDAGYRLYNDESLEKLQLILLFRELRFSLKEIKNILHSSDFDRNKALEQQIELLTLKREHLDNLITFARGIKMLGVNNMDFSAFDTKKLDAYAKQAKENWGKTEAYKEYEQKTKGLTKEEKNMNGKALMTFFVEFGQMQGLSPESDVVQAQVKKLQDFITEHFYTCTKEILSGLGKMYNCGGEMTDNINKAGGAGTAEFAAKAIEIYCKKN